MVAASISSLLQGHGTPETPVNVDNRLKSNNLTLQEVPFPPAICVAVPVNAERSAMAEESKKGRVE